MALDSTKPIDCTVEAGATLRNYLKADGPDGFLWFIKIGDSAGDNEPPQIAAVPIPHAGLISPFDTGADDRIEHERAEVAAKLINLCEEAIRQPPNRSPIRRMVQRGIETMTAACGTKPCDMEITAITDLAEHPDTLDALKHTPIRNESVRVRLCGFASRNNDAKHGTKRAAEGMADAEIAGWQARWAATLVEPPIFEPYCTSAASGTLADREGGRR